MFRENEFRAEVIRKGKTMYEVCSAVGINYSSFFRKLKGESEFKRNELQLIRQFLQLTDDEMNTIFFAD